MGTLPDKFEETLSWALENLSPSFILQSEKLSLRFKEFLGRGSPEDRVKLFHSLDHPSCSPSSRPCSLLSTETQHSTQPSSTASSSQEVLPASSPFALESRSSDEDVASRYFTVELKIKDPARVRLLVQAATGFIQKPDLPNESYEQLWSTKSNVFQPLEHTSRTRRLYEGRKRIKQGSKEYDCAARLSLLFLCLEIEETIASVAISGKKKVTIAFERIAADLHITVDALRKEKFYSRCYICLLQQGGPGDLLELGDSVSTLWERKLQIEDVRALIRFRKEIYPQVDEYFRSLDSFCAQIFFDGLVAYGWTYDELSKSQGDLMTHLFKYVDRGQLAYGRISTIKSKPEPHRKRRCLEQDDTSLELLNQSDIRQSHQTSRGFNAMNLDTLIEVAQLEQASLGTVTATSQLSTVSMQPEYSSISFNPFGQADEAISISFNPFEQADDPFDSQLRYPLTIFNPYAQADDPFNLQSEHSFRSTHNTLSNSGYGKFPNTVSMENSLSFKSPSHSETLPLPYNSPNDKIVSSNSPDLVGTGQVQICNT